MNKTMKTMIIIDMYHMIEIQMYEIEDFLSIALGTTSSAQKQRTTHVMKTGLEGTAEDVPKWRA